MQKKHIVFGIIVVIGFLFQSSIVYAEKIIKIEFSGNKFNYPLPDGFCDITDDLNGILLKEFLDAAKDPLIPVAQVIIGLCELDENYDGYPWGWIGLMENSFSVSQKSLNRMVAKMLKNEDIIDAINTKIIKLNNEALDELFGIMGESSFGEQKIVWADDDGITSVVDAASVVDGQKIKEVILSSTSIIGEFSVHTYLYKLKNSGPSTKDLAVTLINNTEKIKELN